jgi:transcription termination factor NusB
LNSNAISELELNVSSKDTVRPANKRGAARLAAVQALYQMDVAGVGILEVVAEYETYRLGQEVDGAQYLEADAQWFRAIVSGVVEQQKKIDPVIHDSLTDDWPLSRLDSTLRAIMRAGAWCPLPLSSVNMSTLPRRSLSPKNPKWSMPCWTVSPNNSAQTRKRK